jgi:hypothetical protein
MRKVWLQSGHEDLPYDGVATRAKCEHTKAGMPSASRNSTKVCCVMRWKYPGGRRLTDVPNAGIGKQ